MFPDINADQIAVIQIAFVYLAGFLTSLAIVQVVITKSLVTQLITILLGTTETHPKPAMEMDADLDHIDQALAVANS